MINPLDWAKVKLRERKEREAEKKAHMPIDPAGAPSEDLIRSIRLGAWGAYIALMYFLWERVLSVSESQYQTLNITHFLFWSDIRLPLHFPLIIGYVFVVVTVPYVAKFAIPMLVKLSFRENFWAKSWAAFITVAVSVVLITGTATVGGMAMIESERDSAVAVESVAQENAVLANRIEDARNELSALTNNANRYTAIAASMSPEEYQRTYIDERANDWQRDRFMAAMGASRDAARLRQQIREMRDQQARATVAAAVSSDVTTSRSAPVASLLGILNAFWILMLAAIMDIACLLLPWIADTLKEKRDRLLTMREGIPQHAYMIEDSRDQETPVHAAGVDAALEVLMSGGDREAAAEAARAATKPVKPTPMVKEADGTMNTVEYYERKGGMVRKPKRKDRAGRTEAELYNKGAIEVTSPTTGETFTARDVVEKDGRSAAPGLSVEEPPDEIAASEPERNEEEAERTEVTPAADEVDSGVVQQSEPSDADLAFLDAFSTPSEPEHHSTDERADDTPADEVSEAAIVANESDALAEEEERFQPRALIGAK